MSWRVACFFLLLDPTLHFFSFIASHYVFQHQSLCFQVFTILSLIFTYSLPLAMSFLTSVVMPSIFTLLSINPSYIHTCMSLFSMAIAS